MDSHHQGPPAGKRDRSSRERELPEAPRSLFPSPHAPLTLHLSKSSPLSHSISKSSSRKFCTPPPTAGMAKEITFVSDVGEWLWGCRQDGLVAWLTHVLDSAYPVDHSFLPLNSCPCPARFQPLKELALPGLPPLLMLNCFSVCLSHGLTVMVGQQDCLPSQTLLQRLLIQARPPWFTRKPEPREGQLFSQNHTASP